MIRSSTSIHSVLITQTSPDSLGVSQALLLGIVVIVVFGISVFATGFTAKKLDIFDATYGKALWAAVLKNAIFWGTAYLLNTFVPSPPREAVLILAATVVPIVIYKLVFEATLTQAILIWIAVLLVELVVGFALVYSALAAGAILDERFDLDVTASVALPGGQSATVLRELSQCPLELRPNPS